MQQHATTYSVLTHAVDPWGGVNSQKSLKSVMLHIKIKRMEHRAPSKHVFCLAPGVESKTKLFFSERLTHDVTIAFDWDVKPQTKQITLAKNVLKILHFRLVYSFK